MKLVSENSDADLKKLAASEEFDSALEAFATNLLRVAAGAGSPEQILQELHYCVAAASAYRESHNEYPSAHHIASLLDAGRSDTDQREKWTSEDLKRWDANGETMRWEAALAVRRASLRVVAGQWAGHKAVLSNAESAFVKAMNFYCEARDFLRKASGPVRRK